MSPPRTRMKRTNTVSDFSDDAMSDGKSNRKRKRNEPDITALMSEIDTLNSVCNNTFKAVDDLKLLVNMLLEENKSIKTELRLLQSNHAATADIDKLQRIKSTSGSAQAISFASVVKSNPVVIIKPKNADQPSETTKKDLRENMSPTASKFCGVRNVANGGIVIECENIAGSNVLLKDAAAKLGENYVVTIPTKRPTKIRVIGMSEQLSSETLIQKMVAQNPEVFQTGYSAEVVSTFKIKNGFGAKLIIDSDSFAKIINSSKLRLGWDICRVFEDFDLVRCYNCSGYHHLAKNCTSKKQCPKCAGEHSVLECKSTVERCSKCVEAESSLNLGLTLTTLLGVLIVMYTIARSMHNDEGRTTIISNYRYLRQTLHLAPSLHFRAPL